MQVVVRTNGAGLWSNWHLSDITVRVKGAEAAQTFAHHGLVNTERVRLRPADLSTAQPAEAGRLPRPSDGSSASPAAPSEPLGAPKAMSATVASEDVVGTEVAPDRQYTVTVATATDAGAGVSAPVSISLFGPAGKQLAGKPLLLGKSFKPGQEVQVVLQAPAGQDCGVPLSRVVLEMGKTLSLSTQRWHLASLRIEGGELGEPLVLGSATWFDGEHGRCKSWEREDGSARPGGLHLLSSAPVA